MDPAKQQPDQHIRKRPDDRSAVLPLGWNERRPLPHGESDVEAEQMALLMSSAVNLSAWDSIPIVAWSFRGRNHYVWHKHLNAAQVKWDGYEVAIDLNSQSGKAWKQGRRLEAEDASDAIAKAWKYWCNDSFWLNAPAKIFDKGSARSIVLNEDGSSGLMVKYSSGGTTPGDSYLWTLDEKGLPTAFLMWVKIIPLGGLKATWEDWVDLEGALISTTHNIGPLEIRITGLKSGREAEDFGLPSKYFTDLDSAS